MIALAKMIGGIRGAAPKLVSIPDRDVIGLSRPARSYPKVQFLIAGVQKGGTTSLDQYLRQHPGIRMATIKEVHFFDSEEYFAPGKVDYDPYHRHFPEAGTGIICGEATPIYSYWADSVRRIWEYNSAIKLIILLRDPVQRAWSHWKMESRRGSESMPFSVAIRGESQRARQALPLQDRVISYVDRGFYSEQIRRLRRYFAPEQVLFLKSESFFQNPAGELKKVFQFLEVDDAAIDTSTIHCPGADPSQMKDEDKQYLCDLFRWDVEQVKAMLGWDCRDWLT